MSLEVRPFNVLQPTNIDDLLEELSALMPAKGAAIAVDADGTLWSGDVGEEMFAYALEHRLLKPEALPAMNNLASEHGISEGADANEQGRVLFEAFERGKLPNRAACELMTWCYAGYGPDELRPHIQQALIANKLSDRYYAPVLQAVDWARAHDMKAIVVSASPHMVVAEATRALGFSPAEIAGGQPILQGGRWQEQLQYALPYAETKVHASQRMLRDTPLLAAFGDSVFDLELLSSAVVQIAVRPKPELFQRLGELAHCRLLA